MRITETKFINDDQKFDAVGLAAPKVVTAMQEYYAMYLDSPHKNPYGQKRVF